PRTLTAVIPDEIRFLEELTLNALPALQTLFYDGWVMRFAGGYTRRANSVNSLYASQLPPEDKLAVCEAAYTRSGLPTTFKLTSTPEHNALDLLLAARGYKHADGASVQVLDLVDMPQPPGNAALKTALDSEGRAAYVRLNQVAPQHQPVLAQMLRKIHPTFCQATVYDQDSIVALGLGVLEHGHLGIYDVVTDPAQRGHGFGRSLMQHLLRWGQMQGAHTAYLQVIASNTPAMRLYAGLGFRERYVYWYRSRR
ncbi:MAG: GNAT family N-acetyltransferase, partial [Anaerolineae bacterium]|nr:GNAT family N-acetyltransferase [Anaerolineae bacterium]